MIRSLAHKILNYMHTHIYTHNNQHASIQCTGSQYKHNTLLVEDAGSDDDVHMFFSSLRAPSNLTWLPLTGCNGYNACSNMDHVNNIVTMSI